MAEGISYEPTRAGFARAAYECASQRDEVVILGSDVTKSLMLTGLAEDFPSKFISLGIAEQNAAGVAAGLSLGGLHPVFSTYATFATTRALDQIRISVCYNQANVLIGGAHAGISVGPDGATHQALEDIACMRALPGMTVLSPCDSNQTYLATHWALNGEDHGPVYIRFGREAVPNFTTQTSDFDPRRAIILREGTDLAMIATGHMVYETLEAARMLEAEGISATVVNLVCIKPLDTTTLLAACRKARAVLTVEEHQVHGGMGSAVAECLGEHLPKPMRIIGMPDQFGESGSPDELLHKYGLDAEGIVRQSLALWQRLGQN